MRTCWHIYIDSIDITEYKELPEGESEYSTYEKARPKVGEMAYNLIFNNCEHFVNKSKTGVAQSTQVNDTAKRAAVGGGLGVGLAVAGALTIGVGSVVYHFLGSGKNEDQ